MLKNVSYPLPGVHSCFAIIKPDFIKSRFHHRSIGFAWVGIAVMAAPLLTFIMIQLVIKMHQHAMYESLESQKQVSLVIPASQFRWHKTGKEILVNNRHFDCSKVQKIGDRYYVTGAFDSKEDILEEELEEAVRHSTETSCLPEEAIFLVFFSDSFSCEVCPPVLVDLKKPSQLLCDHYTSISLDVLSPPPIFGPLVVFVC